MKDTKDLIIEKLKEQVEYLEYRVEGYFLTAEKYQQLQSELSALELLKEGEKEKGNSISSAWECPRCHKIHSWLDMECDCPPRAIISTTCQGTDYLIPAKVNN